MDSQFVRNGGGIAAGVVSGSEKAERARAYGCHVVLNREETGLVGDEPPADPADRLRSSARPSGPRSARNPHIVFEHVGRAISGISVFVVRRGGTVVTCGSSTEYRHEFDNRCLWMRLKRVATAGPTAARMPCRAV